MALTLNHMNHVTNVKWGFPPVIVVFVSSLIYDTDPQRHATYSLLNENENAEFLDRWDTPYQRAGVQPGFDSVAYRVKKKGEFITSRVPPLGEDINGMFIDACVFAIDHDVGVDKSLDRAKDGTKLIVPARYLVNVSESNLPTGRSDLTADIAPPGLLWMIEVGAMKAGQQITWKARYGKHRDDKDDPKDLPNAMSQIYPLGPRYQGAGDQVWMGYTLFAYRLDRKGTDTVYSKQLSADQNSRQAVDPAWNQTIIAGTSVKGIPFEDPPPLVTEDPITK